MKIGIIGSSDSWHCQELQKSWQKQNVQPVFIDPKCLVAILGDGSSVQAQDINLEDMDLLMVRNIPGGSLEQVIFRMDALHQLENGGLRIINTPAAIEKMVDKYYTLSLLEQQGLLVPPTRVMENEVDAMQAFEQLGGDVVLKPLFGSRGVGMVRLSDREVAGRVFHSLETGAYIYYLQKFIPHGNSDLRVLVIGGEYAAAMERVSNSWKTNISQGAGPKAVEMDDEIKKASLIAAQAVGADYCGVDLLRGEDAKLYAIEVNSMPAWQGLQTVTPFNIADRIVTYCIRFR